MTDYRGWTIEPYDGLQIGYETHTGVRGRGRRFKGYSLADPDQPGKIVKIVKTMKEAKSYIDDYMGLSTNPSGRRAGDILRVRAGEDDPIVWVIGGGMAHRYCDDDDEAQALVDEVQSILGSHLERDGEFVYVKYGYSDVDECMDSAPGGTTEDECIAEMERLDDAAEYELRQHGFEVERLD